MRQRWAERLKRIFEVDRLACPKCGAPMCIIAFILDGAVIAAILRRRRTEARDSRALPEYSPAPAGRAPPETRRTPEPRSRPTRRPNFDPGHHPPPY
jgi:hypothetical protein